MLAQKQGRLNSAWRHRLFRLHVSRGTLSESEEDGSEFVCRCLQDEAAAPVLSWCEPHSENSSVEVSAGSPSSTLSTLLRSKLQRESFNSVIAPSSWVLLKDCPLSVLPDGQGRQKVRELSFPPDVVLGSALMDFRVTFRELSGKDPYYLLSIESFPCRQRKLIMGFSDVAQKARFLKEVTHLIEEDQARVSLLQCVSLTATKAQRVVSERSDKFTEFQIESVFDSSKSGRAEAQQSDSLKRVSADLLCEGEETNEDGSSGTESQRLFTVRRRTSDLKSLHGALKEKLDGLNFPPFPEDALSFVRESTPDVLEQKRLKLNLYFQSLLSLETLPNEPLILACFSNAEPKDKKLSDSGTSSTIFRGADGEAGESAGEVEVKHSFRCTLERGTAIHGTLYVSPLFICFRSNFFGIRTAETIFFEDISRIVASGNVLAPRITVDSGVLHEFGAFRSRDEVLAVLLRISRTGTEHILSDANDDWVEIDSVSDEVPSPLQEEEDGKMDDFDEISSSTSNLSSETFQVVHESSLPCSAVRAFQRLFDKTSFETAYHAKRGDTEISVGEWKNTEFGRVREVSYRAPVSAPIGPKSTRAIESQRLRERTKSRFVMETVQRLLDVPMGDTFTVELLWTVEDVKSSASESCKIRVELGVHFAKRNWFKSTIQSGTISESSDSLKVWKELAFTSLGREEEAGETREEQKETPSQARDSDAKLLRDPAPQTTPDPVVRALLFCIWITQILTLVFLLKQG